MSHTEPHIILVRHGERADKYPDLAPFQEPHNPHLTDVGFQQAIGAGKILRQQFPNTTFRVISSPFRRTIQTAVGIMSQLAATTGMIEIDFDVGEHIAGPTIPLGVSEITDESACAIVQDQLKRAGMNEDEHFRPAKITHGDKTHIVPGETLHAGGVRIMKAVQRIYHEHICRHNNNNGDANAALMPSILIVTHGFAPAQLMTQIYKVEAVQRVYLCSMMQVALNPKFAPRKGSPFALVNNRCDGEIKDTKIEGNEHPEQQQEQEQQQERDSPALSSPLLVRWSRGVKWIHSNAEHSNGADDQDEIERETHVDVMDKCWYEPKHKNKDKAAHFLAYGVKFDMPPQL